MLKKRAWQETCVDCPCQALPASPVCVWIVEAWWKMNDYRILIWFVLGERFLCETRVDWGKHNRDFLVTNFCRNNMGKRFRKKCTLPAPHIINITSHRHRQHQHQLITFPFWTEPITENYCCITWFVWNLTLQERVGAYLLLSFRATVSSLSSVSSLWSGGKKTCAFVV